MHSSSRIHDQFFFYLFFGWRLHAVCLVCRMIWPSPAWTYLSVFAAGNMKKESAGVNLLAPISFLGNGLRPPIATTAYFSKKDKVASIVVLFLSCFFSTPLLTWQIWALLIQIEGYSPLTSLQVSLLVPFWPVYICMFHTTALCFSLWSFCFHSFLSFAPFQRRYVSLDACSFQIQWSRRSFLILASFLCFYTLPHLIYSSRSFTRSFQSHSCMLGLVSGVSDPPLAWSGGGSWDGTSAGAEDIEANVKITKVFLE